MLMDSKPHSRRAEILAEIGPDARAIADRVVELEEQLETAREFLIETHDLIWNADAAMVAGGEKLLDNLAERIIAYLDSNPSISLDASLAQADRDLAEGRARSASEVFADLERDSDPASSPSGWLASATTEVWGEQNQERSHAESV